MKPTARPPVERTILGRTGLEVGVAGLGGGGRSRLFLTESGDDSRAMTNAPVVERIELTAFEIRINNTYAHE